MNKGTITFSKNTQRARRYEVTFKNYQYFITARFSTEGQARKEAEFIKKTQPHFNYEIISTDFN